MSSPSLTPEQVSAQHVTKAITRHVRKVRPFEGGRAYGVDWPTWCGCYPHLASAFNDAARVLTGRTGDTFMPAALNRPNYR